MIGIQSSTFPTSRAPRTGARRLRPAAALAVALGFAAGAAVASAAAPPGPQIPDAGFICKGGTSDGDPCGFALACADPTSECVPDWVKGPGSTLTAMMTVMIDDTVSDWATDSAVYPKCCAPGNTSGRRATTVLLEVKRGGQTRVITQTYQNPDDGMKARLFYPINYSIEEKDLINDQVACAPWLGGRYRQPEKEIAEELLAIAGIAGVARPVIHQAAPRGFPEGIPHQAAGDPLGSAVRCRVVIKFLKNAPILQP